jgi:antitoxin (DNA-binding transcriptional repressor) of toxin-antitoxin stability system
LKRAIEKPDQIWFVNLMKKLTITESKTRLSSLVESVVCTGSPVVIGKVGKPMVQLVRYVPGSGGLRLGAMRGRIIKALDFNSWNEEEARALGLED